jgi:hypothetical protein
MQELAGIYKHPGPFVTVYLDATRATESGEHEVGLRWRALRTSLSDQGADANNLTVLDRTIDEDRETGQAGLVLVATDGQVVFRDRLPRPPVREEATVAPLPKLMPYLAQRGSRTRYLSVAVDREGADLAAPAWLPGLAGVVSGTAGPVHKTGRNTWGEQHFRRRVENAWAANAREVADAVVELAAEHAIELVVVTGDPRARSLLVEQLQSGLREGTEVVSAEGGGRAEGTDQADLAATVDDAVLRHDWRKRREVLEHLQQNLGREHFGVAGLDPVLGALRAAAVDTLVISDDPSSTLRAFIGPEAVQLGRTEDELTSIGVSDPSTDRLDSALVRAVVGTGADLIVTPNAHDYVPDGVGALLRYDEGSDS